MPTVRSSCRRWLRRAGLLATFLLIAFCFATFVVGAVLAEGAIHPAFKRRPSDTAALAFSIAQASGAQATKVQIRGADGILLNAWWLLPAGAHKRGVIVCHGVADSAYGALGYALLFLSHGYAVLVPESRGHGESRGFNTYGVLESGDAVLWLRWMQRQDVHDLYGLGESLGGSILIQALAEGAPLRAVIAECPYASFKAVAIERVARFVPEALARVLVEEGILYLRLRYHVDLTKASPVTAMAQGHVPVLLIHGLGDGETSPENTRVLAAANRTFARTWFVVGATHTGAYATAPSAFEDKVLKWFENDGAFKAAEENSSSRRVP